MGAWGKNGKGYSYVKPADTRQRRKSMRQRMRKSADSEMEYCIKLLKNKEKGHKNSCLDE